jgi:hypothetical protein
MGLFQTTEEVNNAPAQDGKGLGSLQISRHQMATTSSMIKTELILEALFLNSPGDLNSSFATKALTWKDTFILPLGTRFSTSLNGLLTSILHSKALPSANV